MIDPSRDVSIEVVAGISYSMVTAGLLTWNGRQIPFEYEYTSEIDPATGRQLSLIVFPAFGQSWSVTQRLGVPLYEFETESERDAAMMLLIEGMLVRSRPDDHSRWPDDAVRAEYACRFWRLSDFGYFSADGPFESSR